MKYSKPIGIFDSGVGGLTVMKEIIKKLPNEDIIYFGDTGRVPYGSKSSDTVVNFSRQISRFLISNDVKLIVIACNTASSLAYDKLREEFDVPIVEVISSGVIGAVNAKNNKRVGIIGTEGTISSNAYEKKIQEENRDIKVFSKACPLFVPLAEEGNVDKEIISLVCKMYLNELLEKNIKSLVLGCTHYPLLINEIKEIVGEVEVINPAIITGNIVSEYLKENNMLNTKENLGDLKIFTSDMSRKFDDICRRILKNTKELDLILENRIKINIEEY